jgi:TatD DNase family protein
MALMMESLKLIDTHAHLADPSFDEDRGEVLIRAERLGVKAVIVVSETLADATRNLELALNHPLLKPAAGLYPTHLEFNQAEEIIALIRREREKIFAIGEVGLDFWKVQDAAGKERQKEIFIRFIRLARELDLPVNVHSRSAGRHAVDLLLANQAVKVQMHAFDGKVSAALPAVEAGYLFSIPPSIVRSVQKQKLVKQLPLKSLLLESDSPVLGPQPGERNEPANIGVALRAIAEIKGISLKEAAETIYQNTLDLYNI